MLLKYCVATVGCLMCSALDLPCLVGHTCPSTWSATCVPCHGLRLLGTWCPIHFTDTVKCPFYSLLHLTACLLAPALYLLRASSCASNAGSGIAPAGCNTIPASCSVMHGTHRAYAPRHPPTSHACCTHPALPACQPGLSASPAPTSTYCGWLVQAHPWSCASAGGRPAECVQRQQGRGPAADWTPSGDDGLRRPSCASLVAHRVWLAPTGHGHVTLVVRKRSRTPVSAAWQPTLTYLAEHVQSPEAAN